MLLLALALASCRDAGDGLMVGTLERDRIELVADVSEPLVEIAVEDGAVVQAGDLVLRLDPARLDARLAEAKASLRQNQARLEELQRGPRQEAIAQARARLLAAEATLINAEQALERASELLERNLGNEADRDDRLARRDTAQADLEAARQALAELLNGTTVEELRQAEAAVDLAQARVDQATLDRARSELRAPVDALVDRVLFETGEQPPRGAALAVLLDRRRAFARLYVPAAQRHQIVPGVRLDVRLEGVEAPLTGTVRWVSSDATFTPYFALTEYDRSRLSYLAEVNLDADTEYPVGLPLQAALEGSFPEDLP